MAFPFLSSAWGTEYWGRRLWIFLVTLYFFSSVFYYSSFTSLTGLGFGFPFFA
jgi:hypothetical protein